MSSSAAPSDRASRAGRRQELRAEQAEQLALQLALEASRLPPSDDADSAPREGPGGSTDNGDTRAGPEISSSGADKRRRGETEGENGGDNEEEEERVEEEDRRPTPSPRPTRPRRERPDGLIPR
ncbi:hypothetical protein MCOR21_010052 [Pyricularia oryzae]|nr:hypothetical protein MCOR21_010052 [Pyricularia oryzae]